MKDFNKKFQNLCDVGKIILATSFEKLPKSAINRPIWSHWRKLGPDSFLL